MTQLRIWILVSLMGFLGSSAVWGQVSLRAQVTRNSFALTNYSGITVKVQVLRNNKVIVDQTTLGPGNSTTKELFWTQHKLKKCIVRYRVNEETLRKDEAMAQSRYRDHLAVIEKEKAILVGEAERELMIRLTAQLASEIETNPDDGFWMSTFKSIARLGGKVVNGYYALRDGLSSLAGRKYRSYTELFAALAKDQVEGYVREKLYNVVKEKFGLDAAPSYGVVNVLMQYVARSEDIEDSYKRLLGEAKAKFDGEMAPLDAIRRKNGLHGDLKLIDLCKQPVRIRALTPAVVMGFEPWVQG